MQKIMYDTPRGLEDFAIQGLKPITRRIIPHKILMKYGVNKHNPRTYDLIRESKYKVGEIVAIAQRYSSFVKSSDWDKVDELAHTAGWNNKMFVKAELMPHQQKCISVSVERLQDISEEDCLKEGVTKHTTHGQACYRHRGVPGFNFYTARFAFESLIDIISGKGTWDSNPLVWRYEFELIK